MSRRAGTAAVTSLALALSTGAVALSTTAPATAAVVEATPVGDFATSTWTPPSSDPSGIAFIPGKGLLISDAEVEEPIALGQSTNLFYSSVAGVNNGASDDGSTVGWSNEPTGVFYVAKAGNPWNGHLFVTDDDQKRVYDIASAGADGRFGTADDGSRTFFRASVFGNTDPEDVAFDSTHNELWIAGGLSTIVSRVNPGADNNFATTGDNVTKNFELPHLDPDPLKPPSPEGMAYDPERGTIYVLDGETNVVFELARNGAVINQINMTNINTQSAGGITLDPASTGASRTFYIADRGLDPNGTRLPTCPTPTPPGCEAFNDGVVHEVRVATMPVIGNLPPLADAGEDDIADTLEAVTLLGSGEDGETPPSPSPLTYSWTRISGPGTVTLGTPNAPTTTASFSAAGDQVMRLTVSDGSLTDFDDVVVHVFAPAAPRSVTIPIRSGDDDGQEQIGTSSNGFTDLESADNELGNTNGTDATKVMTGLRFTKVPVAQGSTIDDARIQFSVDEVNSSAASYVIRGQLAGNAPPFLHGNAVGVGKFNISSRTPTVASVAWNNVPAWTTVRAEGPAQRTPQLATILQEIVTQPTWARGNAVVFTVQNAVGNTGRRTAEAKDGRIPPYLTLTFRTPLPNVAPIVNAGADASVNVVGAASLDGTVTDDGKPGPTVTTTWSKFSGPGTVTFANAAAQDTTATFSAPGTYTLRLTADDSALSAFDDVVITVQQTPEVKAGPDRTVTLPAAATLDGTVTDDGPVQTTWSKVSGPGAVTFANAALVDTTATFSQPGSYTLRLTANDGKLSAADDMVVQALKVPLVSAGPDLAVTLPAAATLDGTVTDDGPVQTTWSKVSGPGAVAFANPAMVDTTAAFSQPGSYTLRLTGNDGTLNASDDVVVAVGDTATPPSVAPHLSGALTESTLAVGERTRFKGVVSPAVAGQPVQLQRRKGGSWVTVATKVLAAGSSVDYSFTIRPKVSGRDRYRTFLPAFAGLSSTPFDGPAGGLSLRTYRVDIKSVHHAGDEFVKLANTGAVKIDLRDWLLVNRGTGVQRTLPKFQVAPGHLVRIHSGAGASDGNDLYLRRSDMWGKHATALLRNERSVLLDRLTY
jgi:hypothetical protein